MQRFVVHQLRPAIQQARNESVDRCLGLQFGPTLAREQVAAGHREAHVTGAHADASGKVYRGLLRSDPDLIAKFRGALRRFALGERGTPYFTGDGNADRDFRFNSDRLICGTGIRFIIFEQDTSISPLDWVRLARGDESDQVVNRNADPASVMLAQVLLAVIYNDEDLTPIAVSSAPSDASAPSVASSPAQDALSQATGSSIDGSSARTSRASSGSSILDDDVVNRNWRRERITSIPQSAGWLLVHFCDEPPPVPVAGGAAPIASSDHAHARLLTTRFRKAIGGNEFAVRRLLDRRLDTSYALVRMSSVTSKVWVRPAKRSVPGATGRDHLVTMRFT